jgi:hypothetical protein
VEVSLKQRKRSEAGTFVRLGSRHVCVTFPLKTREMAPAEEDPPMAIGGRSAEHFREISRGNRLLKCLESSNDGVCLTTPFAPAMIAL